MSVLSPNMGKKKRSTEPAKKGETSSTKLPTELLRRAKTVAAQRGMDLFDYLVESLAPRVNADYKVAAQRMQQEDE